MLCFKADHSRTYAHISPTTHWENWLVRSTCSTCLNLNSLERFLFDSVLLPLNYVLTRTGTY